MKIISALVAIFFALTVNAQTGVDFDSREYPFKSWSKSDIKQAGTAQNVGYLTQEEQNVIFYCNLARLNGSLFAKTFVQRYIDENKVKKNKYVKSLMKQLKDVEDLTMFSSQKDLYQIAKGHAIKSGKSGHTGHKKFEKRFKNVLGTYKSVGENCDYGNDKALDIVMALLIDDGIKDLGHRKNILSTTYQSLGVSIQPHKKYEYNCVMDFGGY